MAGYEDQAPTARNGGGGGRDLELGVGGLVSFPMGIVGFFCSEWFSECAKVQGGGGA